MVIVGDTLLDADVDGAVRRVAPDAPAPVLDQEHVAERPGGAGLAALLAAADGHDVTLVTALAADAPAARITARLAAAGVRLCALPVTGTTPEKIRLRADGRVLLRLDRGEGGDIGPAPDLDCLHTADAILVSDYGRGVAAHPEVRAALTAAKAPIVWDPHPRGPAPVPGVRLATPNAAEVRTATGAGGTALAAASHGGHELRRRWRAAAVAVTTGAAGAVLCHSGPTPLVVPAPAAADGDTCGAGDRFAAAAAAALASGALVTEAVQAAVAAATAYVAAGGVAAALAPPPAPAEPARHGHDDAGRLAAEVRARGGTVVATGGCFDLLHAGHVATLEAARSLGDCLVVLLNSDASVRGLKGPDRPLNDQHDRARLLAALGCVDAVVVFDEATPEAALTWLRPDVWVKGGDYDTVPESALVAGWGGQTVIVPYLDGHSTTTMIAAARGSRQPEGATR
ncbi:PfkB family carbohydrate kinase [Spirilliplanes yamanashiensis]|uniref:PfkB family carbohydrate kinase n=1 Tax=Spirilliplanes yamanashiensis TaxID=42233 RepID=UPI0035219488